MTIATVTPFLPPRLDGIGDYTANLASELSKFAEVTILTATGHDPCPVAGVGIRQVFDPSQITTVLHIANDVAQYRPDWLLLQYNPFCYGRRGFNPYVPIVLRQATRRSPGTKIAVMFHETFVAATHLRSALMAAWQRIQFRLVGNAADVLLFTIGPWAARFRSWFPAKGIGHVPVGSNIPRISISRSEARKRLELRDSTLVIGLFGTAHNSRMFGLVAEAVGAVREGFPDIVFLYVGPDVNEVRRNIRTVPVIAAGVSQPDEASRRLSAMDVTLAPFVDGISTRRTTLIASLQHAIPVVGTQGRHTDAMLRKHAGRAFMVAEVGSNRDYHSHVLSLVGDAELRNSIGANAERLYSKEFTWKGIAASFFSMLERPVR